MALASLSPRLLGIMLALSCLAACDTNENGRQVRADIEIGQIERALQRYTDETGVLLRDIGNLNNNTAVMKVLTGIEGPEGRKREYIKVDSENLNPDGHFLDPWGRPYVVALASSNEANVRVGSRVLPRRWAVWSIGKNGVNEWGHGDDIGASER